MLPFSKHLSLSAVAATQLLFLLSCTDQDPATPPAS